MEKKMLEDFIAFAKQEYGLTVRPVKSETPDSFESIFGKGFSDNKQVGEIPSSCDYMRETSSKIEFTMDSVYDCSWESGLDWAA